MKTLTATLILFFALLLTSCDSHTDNTATAENTKTATTEVKETQKAEPEVVKSVVEVGMYNPNLDSIFATATTKEDKKQLWLAVSNIAKQNWLDKSDQAKTHWLAISESAKAEWLKESNRALEIFKNNDPNAYRAYMIAERDTDFHKYEEFERTTTSTEYRKYQKINGEACAHYENVNGAEYSKYENINGQIYSHYESINGKAYSLYDNSK